MSFLDRFKKKKSLPRGAKPATRTRRSSAGGGVDKGYLLDGAFYLLDGSETYGSDYAAPARMVSDSGSSYGGGSSYDSGSSYGGGSSSSSSPDSGSYSSGSGY